MLKQRFSMFFLVAFGVGDQQIRFVVISAFRNWNGMIDFRYI